MTYTLLLVDGDPMVRRALERNLDAAGYLVVGTDTAAGALRLLKALKFDFVLTDYDLPDGKGAVLIEYAQSHSIPCELMSASHVDGALAKPFEIEVLLALIRTRLALVRSN